MTGAGERLVKYEGELDKEDRPCGYGRVTHLEKIKTEPKYSSNIKKITAQLKKQKGSD